jgi:hypothetical protein
VGLFRFLGQQYCRETPINSGGYENIFGNLVTVIKNGNCINWELGADCEGSTPDLYECIIV